MTWPFGVQARFPLEALLLLGLVLSATGCATPDRVQSSGSSLVEISCSPFNPVMQTHIMEAVVAGGGPQHVDVAGWMCGRRRLGTVRIVMLRYTPDDEREPGFLVPVLFEHDAMVGFGWHLLEAQPPRYGGAETPTRQNPWRAPLGFSCRRYVEPTTEGPP